MKSFEVQPVNVTVNRGAVVPLTDLEVGEYDSGDRVFAGADRRPGIINYVHCDLRTLEATQVVVLLDDERSPGYCGRSFNLEDVFLLRRNTNGTD